MIGSFITGSDDHPTSAERRIARLPKEIQWSVTELDRATDDLLGSVYSFAMTPLLGMFFIIPYAPYALVQSMLGKIFGVAVAVSVVVVMVVAFITACKNQLAASKKRFDAAAGNTTALGALGKIRPVRMWVLRHTVLRR